MTVYIDIVLLLNLFFDFTMLFTVNYLLKRRIKLYRILLGSIIGSLSILFLFIKISSFELFVYKVIISILMIITTFDYKNIKYTIKNIIYLYLVSIFLGGFLYLINNQFSSKGEGIVFIYGGLSINIVLIMIITPLIIYFYIKQNKDVTTNYSNYYKIDIYIGNKILKVTSFLDTGNKLVDPYTLKPVILINNKDPVFDKLKPILIPFNTISEEGMIRGYKVDKIYIDGVGYKKKVIVGIINNKINIDGVDSIIGTKILEGI